MARLAFQEILEEVNQPNMSFKAHSVNQVISQVRKGQRLKVFLFYSSVCWKCKSGMRVFIYFYLFTRTFIPTPGILTGSAQHSEIPNILSSLCKEGCWWPVVACQGFCMRHKSNYPCLTLNLLYTISKIPL